jgi:Pre-mRNA splicing factor
MAARQEADKRNEEAMLGKAVVLGEQKEVSRAEQLSLLPTFYAEDTPASANETWARLHSDPLFAIRQQEQSARKKIIQNPVKMHEIKAEVGGIPCGVLRLGTVLSAGVKGGGGLVVFQSSHFISSRPFPANWLLVFLHSASTIVGTQSG